MIHIVLSFLLFPEVFSYPEECTCVPFYACSVDYGEDTGPDCNAYLDVCCPQALITVADFLPSKDEKRECGHRSKSGEYPWTVSILEFETIQKSNLRCGGALIHPQVVVTAAHCVNEKGKKYEVHIGNDDFRAYDVQRVEVHPEFDCDTLRNDIALLLLEKRLNVDVVCLPTLNFNLTQNRCLETSWISGIGPPSITEMYVLPRNVCEAELGAPSGSSNFTLESGFMCAGGGRDQTVCLGGAPLICPIDGQPERFFQAGITSWSRDCVGARIPNIYVDMSSFRFWIDDMLGFLNLNSSSYVY